MRKIVYLDSDDVLYDFLPSFCIQYNAITGENIKPDMIYSWDLYNYCNNHDVVNVILHNAHFFANLPLKQPEIPDVIKHLSEDYDLYIVTSAHIDAIQGKIDAFCRDFPFLYADQIIFCQHKHLLKGDYLIDDNADTLSKFKKTNKTAKTICITMPHNKSSKEKFNFRCASLVEAVNYL